MAEFLTPFVHGAHETVDASLLLRIAGGAAMPGIICGQDPVDDGRVLLIVKDGPAQFPERQVGPEDGREGDGRVGRLPEEEVAQTHFARRPDEQFGRIFRVRVETAVDEPLVDVFVVQQAVLQTPGHLFSVIAIT